MKPSILHRSNSHHSNPSYISYIGICMNDVSILEHKIFLQIHSKGSSNFFSQIEKFVVPKWLWFSRVSRIHSLVKFFFRKFEFSTIKNRLLYFWSTFKEYNYNIWKLHYMEIYVNSNSSAWNFIMLLRIVHNGISSIEFLCYEIVKKLNI